jgi:hypothetical protein
MVARAVGPTDKDAAPTELFADAFTWLKARLLAVVLGPRRARRAIGRQYPGVILVSAGKSSIRSRVTSEGGGPVSAVLRSVRRRCMLAYTGAGVPSGRPTARRPPGPRSLAYTCAGVPLPRVAARAYAIAGCNPGRSEPFEFGCRPISLLAQGFTGVRRSLPGSGITQTPRSRIEHCRSKGKNVRRRAKVVCQGFRTPSPWSHSIHLGASSRLAAHRNRALRRPRNQSKLQHAIYIAGRRASC